ncbi:hypothetical protein K469DRAFT_748533 [Zopfia rhizophila CBS 207.26]|uniref:Ecp2 effector protein domain-containing protein n=1 Tax=Zopfia rhizophila CBS 207.26 TaxID=1314779 RepID=A0A6A6E8R1_9PEZI|nr:hypothetical protein K469DRAFT_748533 [Zopfia rhizophila CBS 207.26]
MKTFSISIIATVATVILGATASPIEAPKVEKRACTIKLTFIDSWTDSGLHRFRHAPSIDGEDGNLEDVLNRFWPYPATTGATSKVPFHASCPSSIILSTHVFQTIFSSDICVATECSAIVNNRAVFKDPEHGWVVDENEVYGIAGNDAMDCITHNFMDAWRIDSGCTIAAGSIGA